MSLEKHGLASSSIHVRPSTIRKLAAEAADNGLLAPELAGAIGRAKGAEGPGRWTGNWLTCGQTEQILALPDRNTNKGKRDRALVCLLIGCDLRREELALITLEPIQQRDGRWALVDLEGKERHIRTVPMPPWVKVAIDAWTGAPQITTGRLLRAVNKADRVVGQGCRHGPSLE